MDGIKQGNAVEDPYSNVDLTNNSPAHKYREVWTLICEGEGTLKRQGIYTDCLRSKKIDFEEVTIGPYQGVKFVAQNRTWILNTAQGSLRADTTRATAQRINAAIGISTDAEA